MTKTEILAAISKLPPEEIEDIRQTLNTRHENDAGFKRLDDKLADQAGD